MDKYKIFLSEKYREFLKLKNKKKLRIMKKKILISFDLSKVSKIFNFSI